MVKLLILIGIICAQSRENKEQNKERPCEENPSEVFLLQWCYTFYMFRDRQEAGRILAEELFQYKDRDVIVYALPRGGVVLGYEIAKFLQAPLDLVITRKIGHPANPEYAICAVTEKGEIFCNEKEKNLIDARWLDAEMQKEKKEMKRRREIYLLGRERRSAKGKIAIVVDDGIATGLTILAALSSLKKEQPKELVVAVPVAPHEFMGTLRANADAAVVLQDDPRYFGAVGAYYQNFPQVSDEEVIELLNS